ncbi:MAG: citrate synthase [Sandaracinaceae bacterium]|nr:citrate synthase [Sandaracinaceae bacterium]
MTAAEAAALLGVKRTTLYAYASRGRVRTVPIAGSRERRYARGDLERLRSRSDARAGHTAVAASALRWGEPVLDTAISAITSEGPIYRGVPAVELARSGARFEDAVALLWEQAPQPITAAGPGVSERKLVALLPPSARPLEVLPLAVAALGAADPTRFVGGRDAELARARTLLRRVAAALCLPGRSSAMAAVLGAPSLATAALIAGGAAPRRRSVALIDRALVLCADHELNVSTFAARVAASSGADLYACVGAALCALSGPAHGAACDRAAALVAALARPEDALREVRERAARGEVLAGFGHPLSPDGDPRAAMLIEGALELAPRARTVRSVAALRDAVLLAGGPAPTVDHGLVAVCAAVGLGTELAAGLFALARAAGWVAHIREQREAAFLLRPRARFVGDVSATSHHT